jgi:hypothetical protein
VTQISKDVRVPKYYAIKACSSRRQNFNSPLTHSPTNYSSLHSTQLIGRSVKLLLAFASAVISGFSLLEIHDQDFCSLLDMHVFRNGTFSSTKEGSVFLCRRCVCCTVVSARVYPHCHGVQVTMDSVHPLSLHCTKNIYIRYIEVFCQCRPV